MKNKKCKGCTSTNLKKSMLHGCIIYTCSECDRIIEEKEDQKCINRQLSGLSLVK